MTSCDAPPTVPVPTHRAPRPTTRAGLLVRLRHVLGVPLLVAAAPARHRDRARRLLGREIAAAGDARPATRPAVVVHAVLGTLIGIVGWFVVALTVLATLRGPFYGLVDPGPYDDAWGGPGRVGAWATHAWVWVVTLPVAATLLVGLGALHVRLTAHLLGARRRPWVLPVAVLVALAALVVLRAWIHQL